MRVVAISGFSGTGKTTRILRIIERSVAEGQRVGCIKHTHHPLNEEDRGDTSRMRNAGAERVILASAGEAVIFDATGTRRVTYGEPTELLLHFETDLVLVEGWKGYEGWASYAGAVRRGEALDAGSSGSSGVPRFLGENAAPPRNSEEPEEPEEPGEPPPRHTIPLPMYRLRYRAVLFDLDGTLVDSYAALAEAVNFARREHGLGDLEEMRIRSFVGDGLEKLLQRAFEREEVPVTVREAFEARYDEICCGESKILEDVETTLEELSRLGVIMAVCTNKPTAFSKKILDFLDLSRHFRAIVGPDLAGARKPDARHVLHTLETTECRADETLFVGDMPIDVRAARNSGIDVAVVATGSSTAGELSASAPDHFLGRFADLVTVVQNGARQ